MMKYPIKRKPQEKIHQYANLGMTLEADIEETNLYYLSHEIAVIYKKPTPVQVVSVSYPARNKAKITEAYYKTPSTTDFNGLYQGHYIDFDVKETNSKTSMPLKNIHPHQIQHLKHVSNHGGIAFIIVHFKMHRTYFLLPISILSSYWEAKDQPTGRKSIPYHVFKEKGFEIPFGFKPRLDYLKAVDLLIATIK